MILPRALALAAALGVAAVAGAGAQRRPAATPDSADAGAWRSAGGNPALTRFSPLDQITTANVAGLRPVWSFSTGIPQAHEGSPLVVGAVMFVHTPWPNAVFALDLSRPGAPIKWRYDAPTPPPPQGSRTGSAASAPPPPTGCCEVGSRGVAWHRSGKLYVPLLTGELAALDAETGRELWRVRNTDPRAGGTLAAAPLVVRDLVIVGMSGAEYGVRGHLTAYDALTGRLIWRGWSTGPDSEVLLTGPANSNYPSHQGRDLGVSSWPGDGWRRGGGTTSGWLSWDPALDLVYSGTDQAAPGNPALRTGDDKWTSTIFAREAATGRVRWALQLTPHDEWGFGGANENILVELSVRGTPVRALVHFDRNGFAYTIDRASGKILIAEKYGPVNWATAVDAGTGLPARDARFAAPVFDTVARPVTPRAPRPTTPGICPGSIGTKFLQPAAFSPLTNLFYVPLNNLCMDLSAGTPNPGAPPGGMSAAMHAGPGGNRGRFIAWDAGSASIAWEIREPLPVAGGALTTAGGLVFYGTFDGWLKALDQHTGRELWRFKTPSGIVGNPIAFQGPDGKEYIAVLSGTGGWWRQAASGALEDLGRITNRGDVLLVFGL